MRAASRRLTLLYDEVMAPSGLRLTQFGILAELERRAAEPPTVSELAEILIIERSAIGQALRTLEKDGLVTLDRDLQDSRRRPLRRSQPATDNRLAGSASASCNQVFPRMALPRSSSTARRNILSSAAMRS